MPRLVWTAPMRYWSAGDEAAFFHWLHSIPGVSRVEGRGRELHIQMKSSRLSESSLRELRALFRRYEGHEGDLEVFDVPSNQASWSKVFGPNPSFQRTATRPLN